MSDSCVLCRIIRGKTQTLWENSNFSIVYNLYPYKYGHIMIIPKVHVEKLSDLDKKTRTEFIELVTYSTDALLEFLSIDSVNHGINQGQYSGASVPAHIHYHLVPRRQNDIGFFTTVGGQNPTRIESLNFANLIELLNKKLWVLDVEKI